jgi:hypothetical protein
MLGDSLQINELHYYLQSKTITYYLLPVLQEPLLFNETDVTD